MKKNNLKINYYFGDYKKSNTNNLIRNIKGMDKSLQPYYNFGHPFFKGDYQFDFQNYLKDSYLNYESMSPDEVYSYIAPFFQNLPNWSNPGTMINVIPPVNLISMASVTFSMLYNANIAQDTYSGLLINSELEVSKYISDLIGWNWKQSHGVFTFGGKGTSLYATKIALLNADINTQKEGMSKNQFFMITSETAHPCHYQVCDWLGIGTENCLEIKCDENLQIDLLETERVICKNIESGKIFLGYNLNGGSTNELTIDPIKKISELNEKIIKKYNLKYKPIIHVDTVLGWISLFFNNYDYVKNELNIDKKHLEKIRSLNLKAQEIEYADSVGIDFHKTGFCPYVSSLFLVKNKENYYLLNKVKQVDPLNLKFGQYNPYETTLELSRSSLGPVAALTSLKSLGISGFQQIISNIFSSSEIFRENLQKLKQITVINADTEGFATFFIVLPEKYIDYSLKQMCELPAEEIEFIRNYNIEFSQYILANGIKNKISFTCTSSRSYCIPGTKIKLGAIKTYPMSVFLGKKETNKIIKELLNLLNSFEESKKMSKQINYSNALSDDMVYGQKNN